MGIHDRHYYRDDEETPGMRLAMPHMSNLTKKLIFANLILFALTGLPSVFFKPFAEFMSHFFYLNNFSNDHLWPWQIITWAFLHSPYGLKHLLFNMLLLLIFSSRVEDMYPEKKFITIFFSSAIFSAVCVLIYHLIYPSAIPILGASGVCFAIMVLFACRLPNLMFFCFLPTWLLVGAIVAIDFYAGIVGMKLSPNGLAPLAAHLGGALYGFLVFKFFDSVWQLKSNYTAKKQQATRQADVNLAKDVDTILAKISKEGIGSLTKAEKDTLNKASGKYKKD